MPIKKPEMSMADAFTMLSNNLKTQAARPNIFGYIPHDKQLPFHSSPKKKRLYIGGNRSGKTTGGIVEDIWWLTGTHPYRETPEGQIRGRVVSVDFINGIEKIIIPELARWCPPSSLRGGGWSTAYDRQTRTLNFANGSFVEFMSYDQDLDKFAGTSRHFVHFDEEPPEDIYTECLARLVDTGGEFWITMTPVEGMTWIFDALYEPGVAGEKGIEVIQVSMTENPHLNAGEVQAFLDSLSPDERKAREEGKFVQLGGLIWKDYNREKHTVEAFIPPKDWVWVASLDHGFHNPTAWLWHAISPDGQLVTFFEHYVSGVTIDTHAKAVHVINQQLGRPPDYYIGDPSIRNTDPITGTSIQQEYIKYGIPVTLANNDVRAGINRVAGYLKVGPSGKPRWVATENCVNLLKEMGRYRWRTYASKRIANANNLQEEPQKKDDHACDSLRYFVMSRPDLSVGFSDYADSSSQNPMQAPVAVGVNSTPHDWGVGVPNETQSDYASRWSYDEQFGAVW